MKSIHTCKGCGRRVVGCHATCETYQAARKALDEEKRKVYEAKKGRRDEYDLRSESISKIKKRQGRRGKYG